MYSHLWWSSWNRRLAGGKMTRKSKLQIRVSDDEEQLIRLKMSEYGFRNLSDFIRTSIISPSDRNKVQLQPLLYEVNKIGVNLNQAIYLMHRKGITDKDLLESIDMTNSLLLELIKVYKRHT